MPSRLEQVLPLCSLDEYPVHQSPKPLRFPEATDPRVYDRYWFTVQDREATMFMVVGIGFYPNLGTVDGYALFVHDGKQVNVRVHDRLVDRSHISVGPLRAEPVVPFEEWHLALSTGDHGLAFDLRWRDTKRANYRRFPVKGVYYDTAGYEAFGRIEGWVTCGDKTFTISPDRFVGSRDHHWGVRDGVGGVRLGQLRPGVSHTGQWVEFADWAIWGDQVLYNFDDPRRGAGKVRPVEQRLRFDPNTRQFIGGTVVNRFDDGEIREVHYERIPDLTAYLRGGGYSSPSGLGTPDENICHGMDVGKRVQGETWDVRDCSTLARVMGFENQLCWVTCGTEKVVGIYECCNPDLYAMCERGVAGFSFDKI
jgi:hypothetical protein